MNRQSQQTRLAYFALLPSFLSATLCIGLATAILIITGWAFIGHNPVLYQYLFGPDGFAQVQAVVEPSSLSGLAGWHSVSLHEHGGFIFSYLLIAFIGAALYSGLEISAIALGRAQRSAAVLHTLRATSKMQLVTELVWRAALRFGVLIVVSLYALYFVRVIVPYCAAQSRFGIATIVEWRHVGYILLSGALLCAGLHVFVVLVRLFCLRPRVFGSIDVLLRSESKE